MKHKMDQEQLRQRMRADSYSSKYVEDFEALTTTNTVKTLTTNNTNGTNGTTSNNTSFLMKPMSSHHIQHSVSSDISSVASNTTNDRNDHSDRLADQSRLSHEHQPSPNLNEMTLSMKMPGKSEDVIEINEMAQSARSSHSGLPPPNRRHKSNGKEEEDEDENIANHHDRNHHDDLRDETESYEEPDTDTDREAMLAIDRGHGHLLTMGTLIGFGKSDVILQCVDIKTDFGFYEFEAPHALSQDLGIDEATKLHGLRSTRSHNSAFTGKEGTSSPISFLSQNPSRKPSTVRSFNGIEVDNPFTVDDHAEPDAVRSALQRQEYMSHFTQFFTGTVYLTPQQLQSVIINPVLPDFIKSNDFNPNAPSTKSALIDAPDDCTARSLTPFTPKSVTPMTPNSSVGIHHRHRVDRKRNRSHNIRKTAHLNTEVLAVPKEEGAPLRDPSNAKIEENKALYDEDKKLAALLQSLSRMNYHFVPNGLLTHNQFIEFIDNLQIYNYERHVLKHMFRYIYTEELPPTLPPPPVIAFSAEEEDNYNNVNGMYVADSECIGYEYDEVLDVVEPYLESKNIGRNMPNNNGLNGGLQPFDDVLTLMVMKTLQSIYKILKFDDLAHHPNSFLCRQTSFAQKQQKDKLNGDELKQNVFSYFDERNDKKDPLSHHHNHPHHLHSDRHYESSTALSTMRSTQSETATFNNSVFRQSIISHDSNLAQNLQNVQRASPNLKASPNGDIPNVSSHHVAKTQLVKRRTDLSDVSVTTAPKLDHATSAMSASTITVTVQPQNMTPRTPLTPMTQHTVNTMHTVNTIGSLDKLDKFPALMDHPNSESPNGRDAVRSEPNMGGTLPTEGLAGYHRKMRGDPKYNNTLNSVRNQLLRNSSINDMVANGRVLSELSDTNSMQSITTMATTRLSSTTPKKVPNSSPRNGFNPLHGIHGHHEPLPRLEQSPSITNITGITNVANVDEYTPKDMTSDDEHHVITGKDQGNGIPNGLRDDLSLPLTPYQNQMAQLHGSLVSNGTLGTTSTLTTLDTDIDSPIGANQNHMNHNMNHNVNSNINHNLQQQQQQHHQHHVHVVKGKRKKHFAASRQPSLPTLPEEHAQQKGTAAGGRDVRDANTGMNGVPPIPGTGRDGRDVGTERDKQRERDSKHHNGHNGDRGPMNGLNRDHVAHRVR